MRRTPRWSCLVRIVAVTSCVSSCVSTATPPERQPNSATSGFDSQLDSTLRPVLRWQELPPYEEESTPDGVVSELRYDLRIRRAKHPLELVYYREGLPEAHHELESPLEADTAYTWEVRSRFRLAGEERVSAWQSSVRGGRSTLLPAPSPRRFTTP